MDQAGRASSGFSTCHARHRQHLSHSGEADVRPGPSRPSRAKFHRRQGTTAMKGRWSRLTIVTLTLALTACATAQFHTEAQLNEIATSCGLAYGEVVQEAE